MDFSGADVGDESICLRFYVFGIQSLQLRCEFYLESSFCATEKGFGLGVDQFRPICALVALGQSLQ